MLTHSSAWRQGRLGAMKLFIALLLAAGGLAFAQSPTPFVDVPPCHWAADAVGRIAGEPQVTGAQTSTYLVENAVQQVFEGLKCGNLDWSAYFLTNVPAGTAPQGTLQSFDLSNVGSSINGNNASMSFTVTAVVDGQTFTREGEANLVFMDGRWVVDYSSLAALGLPVLP